MSRVPGEGLKKDLKALRVAWAAYTAGTPTAAGWGRVV